MPLAEDASPEAIAADTVTNADAFAELIQYLDNRSLSLIIRDAANDGQRALAILREHYLSKGKPRVISLYTELTSLKKSADENVTDYMLRTETTTSLKSAGEQISDSLLITMIIKGIPSEEYKPFLTVMTQKDKDLSFGEFEVSLQSFEVTQELSIESDKLDSITHVAGKLSNRPNKEIICYGCKKPGHKISSKVCRAKKRWCEVCKNQTHDTEKCRKKKHANDATKTVRNSEEKDDSRQNENHSFIFKIGVDLDNVDCVNGY